MRGSLLGDERALVAFREVDVLVALLRVDALRALALALQVDEPGQGDEDDREGQRDDHCAAHERAGHDDEGGRKGRYGDRQSSHAPEVPAYRRGKRDVSTTSNALPGTSWSECRSSLSQPRLGAPLTYQDDPLSATIIP